MFSPDDSEQTTGTSEPASRPPRRGSLAERRQHILQQKQTDHLPSIGNDAAGSRMAWRQVIQLREENKRLHWEIAEIEKDLETVHQTHLQEIEHLQYQLQETLEERNSQQQEHAQLERRYQELYFNFQNAVEEEAQHMVAEAARTIELTPDDQPLMRNDVMKTVELHVRQAQDKHTAEALYLMRQAQRKAAKLEYELNQERQLIAAERQNLANLQESAREQAELRKRIIEERLRAQYTLTLTSMTSVLLLLLPIAQLALFSFLHTPMTQQFFLILFAPLVVCVVLAGIFAYIRSSARIITTSVPHKRSEPKKPENVKVEGKKV